MYVCMYVCMYVQNMINILNEVDRKCFFVKHIPSDLVVSDISVLSYSINRPHSISIMVPGEAQRAALGRGSENAAGASKIALVYGIYIYIAIEFMRFT